MEIALTIFSSISVATCIFLILYFLFIRKENPFHDIILGLFFLAIALRISKSIIYYVFSGIDTIGVALGFLGFSSIGPLLLLYFKNSIMKSGFSTKHMLHFAYPILGFILINLINGYDGKFYLSALLSMSLYTVYIGAKFLFNKNYVELITLWHKTLFYAIIALIGAFTFQHWGGSMLYYTIGTAIASLIIYILFFYALKSPVLIKKTNRIIVSEKQINQVVKALEVDKSYLEPAITLVKFSETIDLPTYIISKVTKSVYNKSFPETINSFRIKDIKDKLIDPKYKNDKIENLAFDSGFKTPSAFYSAFKKETQKTPREYQKMIIDDITEAN
ncbi:hypothetical protein BFR04_16790 [Gaetbulibacter sp. 4G1]|nr:helix-turn-helix domain-containing protein [Gaetbulibacter sp. 4G1]PIA80323.1 hypothetical protein BFR04_16790 [Gaetbulibacter sp. 4G1]